MQLGGARDFSVDESIAMAHLGVRSQLRFDLSDDWELRWGNTLRWAGEYQMRSEDRWSFGVFETGLDIRTDTGLRLFGKHSDAGVYYIYQHFMPRWLSRSDSGRDEASIGLHQFGVSFGLKKQHKLFGIPVQRVRVGYKTGGGFEGWTIGTEFPF